MRILPAHTLAAVSALFLLAAVLLFAAGCDSPGAGPDSSSKPATNHAAPKPTPAPSLPAAQGKVTITWGTESEQECYGYYVWRAETQEGPFEKVNAKMVPGGGTTHVPRRYRVVDQPLPMGATYYYKVEQIDLTGARRDLTPVVPCTVTQSADPEEKAI